MPIQYASLFDALRQRWIGEIHPVEAAKLDSVPEARIVGVVNGVWHPWMHLPCTEPARWLTPAKGAQRTGPARIMLSGMPGEARH